MVTMVADTAVLCLRKHRSMRILLKILRTQVFAKQLQHIQTRQVSSCKTPASQVLTCYIKQCKEPPWTSYFVKYSDVVDDQWGWSHFNWTVGESNYHILRTGCYPYIKYHCTRRPHQDLTLEDKFFRVIKVINLGIPCLAYGMAAVMLIQHKEQVHTSCGSLYIYFLYEEDKGSQY